MVRFSFGNFSSQNMPANPQFPYCVMCGLSSVVCGLLCIFRHLKRPTMDYSKIETWILLLFIFFFGVLLIRYILSVDKLLKNQDRTNKLLQIIAEKVGIDKNTLDNLDKE